MKTETPKENLVVVVDCAHCKKPIFQKSNEIWVHIDNNKAVCNVEYRAQPPTVEKYDKMEPILSYGLWIGVTIGLALIGFAFTNNLLGLIVGGVMGIFVGAGASDLVDNLFPTGYVRGNLTRCVWCNETIYAVNERNWRHLPRNVVECEKKFEAMPMKES